MNTADLRSGSAHCHVQLSKSEPYNEQRLTDWFTLLPCTTLCKPWTSSFSYTDTSAYSRTGFSKGFAARLRDSIGVHPIFSGQQWLSSMDNSDVSSYCVTGGRSLSLSNYVQERKVQHMPWRWHNLVWNILWYGSHCNYCVWINGSLNSKHTSQQQMSASPTNKYQKHSATRMFLF